MIADLKITAIAVAVAFALGFGAAHLFYSPRIEAAVQKGVADVAKLQGQHEQAVRVAAERHAEEINKARATERSLRDDIDQIHAQNEKERANARAENDRLVADLRSGNRRLSVAVRSCSAAPRSGDAAGSSAAAANQEARAELDPAASERIVAITRDGDEAISDLNACIDAYEAVKNRLNPRP